MPVLSLLSRLLSKMLDFLCPKMIQGQGHRVGFNGPVVLVRGCFMKTPRLPQHALRDIFKMLKLGRIQNKTGLVSGPL